MGMGGTVSKRTTRALVVAFMAAACSTAPGPSPSPPPHQGGTLRIGVTGGAQAVQDFTYADPGRPIQQGYGQLLKCCLARTLLSYPGRSTADGGTVLQPDLAAGPPLISRDGRTWTFHLRTGIRYAPPFEGVEVVAADFIRAAERTVRLAPESTETPDAPFSAVAGAAEYAAGNAPTITGLESPDPRTLVVRLVRAWGGFGTSIADVAWSPIPEAVAIGHDEDLGWNWVSTGPYMFEHYPADPTATTAALVRNPSWVVSTDARRGAWVERIEIRQADDAIAGVERGEFDLLDTYAPGDVVDRYRSDPALSTRLAATLSEYIFYIPMNLAVPPFDDVAVRRAVNFALDRATLRDLIRIGRETAGFGPQRGGVVATHVFADSLTEGLLLTYDPFPSARGRGDLGRAREEMRRSRYDGDGDGVCDDPVCTAVTLPAFDGAVGAAIRDALAPIGIEATVVGIDELNDMLFPAHRTAIQANPFGWGYALSGSEMGAILHGGSAALGPDGASFNFSLVGASPEQLAGWGYDVGSVPSVDDLIDRCDAEVGHLRARCWAELDQKISEAVVPWVPVFSFESAHIVSARVATFALDQSGFAAYPALDQISLRADAAP